MTWTKDNQKVISIIFVSFFIGAAVGYNIDNAKRDVIDISYINEIDEMKVRHAISMSRIAKSLSMIDSIKNSNDSLSKIKDDKYNRILIDYKKYKDEVKKNRQYISTVPAAQYVIDSILQSNGIRN